MNRPIDPDLDDRPNVHAMNVDTLRRNLVSISRDLAEERTENRRLKQRIRLLEEYLEKNDVVDNPGL